MPPSLHEKLNQRKAENAFRSLQLSSGTVDFCSNDYLGVASSRLIDEWMKKNGGEYLSHGSTGSRLLAGNSRFAENLEKQLAAFHESEDALLFNSGYDANLGLLSTVPQKNDHIIYDQLSHASIRDGIRLGFAKGFGFQHNDMDDLKKKLNIPCIGQRYIVTESVFSMDGDVPPMEELVAIAGEYGAYLIIDEAHGIGIAGKNGAGVMQCMNLHQHCFARVYTFGKAMGCHGAIVAGSTALKDFLVNYCRSFIYTTALPEVSLAAIQAAYHIVPEMGQERNYLNSLARRWSEMELPYRKLVSETPVQGIIVPGTNEVKRVEAALQANGIAARAILSPTVPEGLERIRLVFHAFNTEEDLLLLRKVLEDTAH